MCAARARALTLRGGGCRVGMVLVVRPDNVARTLELCPGAFRMGQLETRASVADAQVRFVGTF